MYHVQVCSISASFCALRSIHILDRANADLHRIRHVKCDEEKPSCLKCRSTGRTCDGYLVTDNWRFFRPKNSSTWAVVSPPLPASEILHERVLTDAYNASLLPTPPLTPPIASVMGTDQERQCFEYFRLQTGEQLGAVLMQEPTTTFVLQACHADPAIRSAVIAIGSMGQRLRVNNLLIPNAEEANAFQHFAQVQYYNSLKQLRAQMSSNPSRSVNLAITTCLLLTVFEFLRGNDVDLLIHLKSGLDILRHGNNNNVVSDPLRQELMRIFSVLDIQATIWLGLPTFQAPAIMPLSAFKLIVNEPNDGLQPPHDDFLTLEDASASLFWQITRTILFRRSLTATTTSLEHISPTIFAQGQNLMTQLKHWPSALEALLERLPEATPEMTHRITIMRLNYILAGIALSACLQRPELHFRHQRYDTDYRQIVELAKAVVRPSLPPYHMKHIVALNHQDANPVTPFHFYTGVIHPLYVAAVNCRCLEVCREAISLLAEKPWREGAWDSASMARIAERKVRQLQDEGFYDGLGEE